MTDQSGFQVGEDAPEHYEAQVERFMSPFVSALVAAAVEPGDQVLDVACGTGFAARAAALAVGPSGTVVGSDVNPAMLAMARSVNVPGVSISWREASALDLPFADGAFDVVLCQQGVQFFPRPEIGLREMARVLRSVGQMAVTVWDEMDRNPFFEAEVDMLVHHCGIAPDAWSSGFPADPARQIASWFENAGITQIEMEHIEVMVSLPPPAAYVPQHLRALPWPSGLFELSDAARERAIEHITNALAAYATADGIEVPFRSYLAVASV